MLGIKYLWEKVADAMEALLKPPFRVMVQSAHSVGKTHFAAMATNWWFDTFDPGVVITTAPTEVHIKNVLWAEIRMQRLRAGLPDVFIGPAAPEMRTSPVHYAQGLVSSTGEAFQGRHPENLLFVFDEACHDDQTEVLSYLGWRKFSDLDGTEPLLTMNPETMAVEYVVPLKIIRRYYQGEMYEYKANNANFCVTPDHQMFWQRVSFYKGKVKLGKWQKSSIESMPKSNVRMTRIIDWQAKDADFFVVPPLQMPRKLKPERVLPMDDWLRLLAWYFSEGSLFKTNGEIYGFCIYQKKDLGVLEEIYRLCLRLGMPAKIYEKGGVVHVHCAQVGRWLSAYGRNSLEKRLPDCVRHASARQIGIFLDTYVRGDGYKRQGRDIIYTSSPRMAADLHELIAKAGSCCFDGVRKLAGKVSDLGTHKATSSVDGHVVTKKKPTNLSFKSHSLKKTPYDGDVWCAALPKHHLLFTRRGGHAIWSGNCGIDMDMWDVTKTMFRAEPGNGWLAIFNPTNQSTPPGVEQQRGEWHTFSLSALDHPNIDAELKGEPRPIPPAVSLSQVKDWVQSWTTPVSKEEKKPEDIEWPPNSGKFLRPGPEAEARLLGRWPSSSVYGIWSEVLFDYAVCPMCRGKVGKDGFKLCDTEGWVDDKGTRHKGCPMPPPPLDEPPHLGIDVARGTDATCDYAAIHVRWGFRSLLHESMHGWRLTAIAGRATELAKEYCSLVNNLRRQMDMEELHYSQIPIKVDDDAVGAGVTDMLLENDMFVIAIRAAHNAHEFDKYPDKRSELWFQTALRASKGKISLAKLDQMTLKKLKSQFMAPKWQLTSKGLRQIEKKELTRETLGRSPDDADSVNLAFYEGGQWEPPAVIERDEIQRPHIGPELVNYRNEFDEYNNKPRSKWLKIFGR